MNQGVMEMVTKPVITKGNLIKADDINNIISYINSIDRRGQSALTLSVNQGDYINPNHITEMYNKLNTINGIHQINDPERVGGVPGNSITLKSSVKTQGQLILKTDFQNLADDAESLNFQCACDTFESNCPCNAQCGNCSCNSHCSTTCGCNATLSECGCYTTCGNCSCNSHSTSCSCNSTCANCSCNSHCTTCSCYLYNYRCSGYCSCNATCGNCSCNSHCSTTCGCNSTCSNCSCNIHRSDPGCGCVQHTTSCPCNLTCTNCSCNTHSCSCNKVCNCEYN